MYEGKSSGNRLHNIMGQIKSFAALIVCGALVMLAASPAEAIRYEMGDFEIQTDFTLGYGISFRAVDADPSNLLGLIYPPPPQQNFSSKPDTTWSDAGDTVSSNFNVLAEFGMTYKNFGMVSNMSWNYDREIMDHNTGRAGTNADTGTGSRWTDGAEDDSGNNFEVIDAYAYGEFEPGEIPVEVRFGKQVINWGEGLFFFDGVSTQVPFNLAKLVLPGSELKEAFIGVEALYAQVAPTDNLALEAYAQFKSDHHLFPATGTFYGDDLYGPGTVEDYWDFPIIPRLKLGNDNARDGGQWGASAKYILGDWELGAYYSRYHHFFPQPEFMTNPVLGLDGYSIREVYPEDQSMYGASFSTSLGMWSINGEIAYRPDNELTTDFVGVLTPEFNMAPHPTSDFNDPAVALFGFKNGEAFEEHDTITASVHGLGYYGGGPLGVDTNFYMVQLGWEHIDGSQDNLLANYNLSSFKSTNADADAFGLAGQWDATWQNAFVNNLDITTSLFAQYDFSGNSHWWGNFLEKRFKGSLGVTGNYGSAWEANVTYAMMDYMSDTYDSNYERQDTVNFSVNYKF